MTTPNDLYAMTPEIVTKDLTHLEGCYYNHVEEIGTQLMLHNVENDRVEVRFLKDYCFDGRRVWQLATVWFDEKPVMITQNAGREGDDYAKRFITDAVAFVEMCQYIKSLLKVEPLVSVDPVDPDEDVEGLTKFYGNELGGIFERYRY